MPLSEALARVRHAAVAAAAARTQQHVAAGYDLKAEVVTGMAASTSRSASRSATRRTAARGSGCSPGTHENAFNSRGWVEAERRVRHKYIGKNSEEATMKFSKSLLGKVPPGDYFFVLSTNNFGQDEGGGRGARREAAPRRRPSGTRASSRSSSSLRPSRPTPRATPPPTRRATPTAGGTPTWT